MSQATLTSSQVNRTPAPRRVLLITTALLLAAIGLAACVLFAGMLPSEKAQALRDRMPVPALKPGQFAFTSKLALDDSWPGELLFVRLEDGSLRVFDLPTEQGGYAMPDSRLWWYGGYGGQVCRKFEVDFALREMRCTQGDLDPLLAGRLRWTLEGLSLHPLTQHMMLPAGRIEGDEFVFVESRPRIRYADGSSFSTRPEE